MTGKVCSFVLESAAQAGVSGAPAYGMRVAAASTVSRPSPTTSCDPAGHSLTTPARPSMRRVDLLDPAVAVLERDALNPDRLIGAADHASTRSGTAGACPDQTRS